MLIILLIFLGYKSSFAQEEPPSFRIIVTDKDSSFLEQKKIIYNPFYSSEKILQKELHLVKMKLAHQSYLASSIDSIVDTEKGKEVFLHVGESFKWARLERGTVEDVFLDKIGFRERFYSKKPFYYKELLELIESLQVYAENHGYPFVVVGLDSIQIHEDHSISAQLKMDKNLFITYEGVEIIGDDVKVSAKYLQNYLGIKPGAIYNLKQIKEIPNRLREIPFVKKVKSPVVSFRGSKATIHLFLKKKKASKFDFLVGVLPRNEVTGSRVLITVDGMFSAQNLLGGGEKIHLEFRQLRQATQRLDVELAYPYIFGLPFGIDGDFSLYKRDSSYLDLEYDGGVSYLFSAQHYLKIFGHSKSSFLLELDTDPILQSKKLPQNLDTRFTDFGLEHHIENLDYRFNPRKGWRFTTKVAAGFKSVEPNNDIINLVDPSEPTFNFETLYDSLETRSIQYQIDATLQGFIPFYPEARGVIMLSNQTGSIFSNQNIFLNETYRLGGTKILRGFDEESIFASTFSIFTLEYRFLIGTNSYFYLFGDYGFVENKSLDIKSQDDPIGFGAGMTFDTKIGVFGISYAYGKQFDNPIDFRAAKIHFGYINYF